MTVSIIIPTYNRVELIEETLNSVKSQTYGEWECIIVDDHSTDRTSEIVKNYIKEDPRFCYILNKGPKGAQGARNTGTSKAYGDYLIYLDSDDLLAPECLKSRLDFVRLKPPMDFYCFTTGVFVEKPFDTPYNWNYLSTGDNDLIRFLMQDMPWHTSGVLWKKETLNKLNGWDESLTCWQDWDIHLRAILCKMNYAKADALPADSFYRKDGNYTSISIAEQSSKSIATKLLLLNKFEALLPLEDPAIKMEFARLIFRISYEIFIARTKSEAIEYLTIFLRKLGFSNIYIKTWIFYFSFRLNEKYPLKIRKSVVSLIPLIFRGKDLRKHNRSFLRADASIAQVSDRLEIKV